MNIIIIQDFRFEILKKKMFNVLLFYFIFYHADILSKQETRVVI